MAVLDWLASDRPPADLCELLGWPQWNLDRERLLEAVRLAYAQVLPYQEHSGRQVAERAIWLQRELGRAADILSDPAKFRAHQPTLLSPSPGAEAPDRSDHDTWPSASCGIETEPGTPSDQQPLRAEAATGDACSQAPDAAPAATTRRFRVLCLAAVLVVLTVTGAFVWVRVTSGPQPRILEGHASSVTCLAFRPDSTLLASGGEDKAVRLWDVSGEGLRRDMEGHQGNVTALAFSPDGSLLASASDDKTVKLWRVDGAVLDHTLGGHERGVTSVAFNPTGRLLASASNDGTIRLWDVARRRLWRTLEGHKGGVTAVAFSPGLSPNEALLASGGDDGTVRLWDWATGRLRQTFEGHQGAVRSVTFKPDGATVVSAGWDRTVKLWNIVRGELRQTVAVPSAGFASVVLYPDGVTLASGGEDKTVKIWDLVTGEVRRTFPGHRDRVTCVAFSPDGSLLASGSGAFDRAVRLWELGPPLPPGAPPPPRPHNEQRYLEACGLMNRTPPDYAAALYLFQANIFEAPNAEDIDFDYVNAAICCARLERCDDASDYYLLIVKRFSNGARNWQKELDEVKRLIAQSSDPACQRALKTLDSTDKPVGGGKTGVKPTP